MSDKTLYSIIKQIVDNTINESNQVDVRIGTVESINPLKIRVSKKLLLTEPFLKLSRNVKDYETKMVIDGITKNVKVLNGLKKGENVIMVKYQNGQKYLVLERAD